MSTLPPASTPLDRHSLSSLEAWLIQLGAIQNSNDPSKWALGLFAWSADISFEKDALRVVWMKNGNQSQCRFSYSLPRQDVESAIIEGP